MSVIGEPRWSVRVEYWPVVPVEKSPPSVGSWMTLKPVLKSWRWPPRVLETGKSSLDWDLVWKVGCGVLMVCPVQMPDGKEMKCWVESAGSRLSRSGDVRSAL